MRQRGVPARLVIASRGYPAEGRQLSAHDHGGGMGSLNLDELRELWKRIAHWISRFDHWLHASAHFTAPFALIYLIVELEHKGAISHAVFVFFVGLILLSMLLAIGVGIVSYSSSRTRLVLARHWQALAWTHYRFLLSELSVRSVQNKVQPQFDYLTFSSGDFGKRLRSSGPREFLYSTNRIPSIDFVICDIEEVDELRSGVNFSGGPADEAYYAVDFERFVTSKCTRRLVQGFLGAPPRSHLGESFPIPEHFALSLCADDPKRTYGIPLRWGYSGIAVNLKQTSLEALKAEGFDLAAMQQFDLSWLLTDHPLRRWAMHHKPIVVLDWYLPAMLLLSWYLVGGQRFQLLENTEFKAVTNGLDLLAQLMHRAEAFVADPLRLVRRMQDEEDLIVLGGGNWLMPNEPVSNRAAATHNRLRVMPISQGYLLWCECLVFLAHGRGAPDSGPLAGVARVDREWQQDAEKITEWMIGRHRDFSTQFAFGAYEPKDPGPIRTPRDLTTGVAMPRARRLPPMVDDRYVTRAAWEAAWLKWKGAVGGR